jgi:hypothetical protein
VYTGAQINFGDLTPYLTYDSKEGVTRLLKKQTNENTKIFIERTQRELGKGCVNKPCVLYKPI